MTTKTTITDIASKTLGSSASYAVYTDKYDPTLINPMPRELARKDWGIVGNEFKGYDVWHCHEATFLLDSGMPIAGTLKYVYSADSTHMVESKSAKLYLNSFDMCKMGSTIEKAISNYEYQVKTDLEKNLNTEVQLKFFTSGSDSKGASSVLEYRDLFRVVSEDTVITDYASERDHLFFEPLLFQKEINNEKFFTNALRSRCRHTKQKDTGSAYINTVSIGHQINPTSLFKQIVSLREINEFHEFCAEKLFIEIMKHNCVQDCCVTLMYSRRGSLDICPVRSNSIKNIPAELIDPNIYTTKTMGQ
jgi:7-cyano-7-deazaguanine reductase